MNINISLHPPTQEWDSKTSELHPDIHKILDRALTGAVDSVVCLTCDYYQSRQKWKTLQLKYYLIEE